MKTIILFRFSAMGDVAMTIPVIEQFLERYQQYKICVVSRPKFQPMFKDMERVIFFPADIEKEYHGIKGLFVLFQILRKSYPETVFLDLHAVLRTHIIGLFARLYGLRYIRLQKPRHLLQQITQQHHKHRPKIPTVFERYSTCFQKLEIDFKLVLDQPLQPRFCDPKVLQNKKFSVGIAPFAQHQGKILPIATMIETITLIIQQCPTVHIFLFGGGKQEGAILSQIATQFTDNITNCSTMNSLSEELKLISSLDVMISMDSANMHLASLCNVRVISVWGATDSCCGFLGWRQTTEDCIAINLGCRPCSVYGNKPCFSKDYACLIDIKSADIADKTLKLFNERIVKK